MQPKVSIVVPIYNVEKYLSKCIDSLINQTLKDIEIILVDDGSPDSSGKIADDYKNKDSRIKVIHQKNAGLGPARNSGMKAATGEYIGFVDSDDWVTKEMFERLYQCAVTNAADIVVSGHCDWSYGKIVKRKVHPLAGQTLCDKNEIDNIRINLYSRDAEDREIEAFPMSVWIAIYRRKMIEINGLAFKNILSEDIIFNLGAYKCANVISFTGDTDYCYRKEEQASITQTFSESKLKKYEEYLMTIKDFSKTEKNKNSIMRVKRAAINSCRLYVGQVGNADIPWKDKIHYVDMFAKSQIVRELWKGYPINKLPFQQRIFQYTVQSGHYGTALFMNSIRQYVKRLTKK